MLDDSRRNFDPNPNPYPNPVKVYAYDGPSDLLRKFLDKTRRCNHYGSSLLFEGKELDVSGDGEEQSLFALK
eukprot:26878-Amorphochlora_amoeboformis.AAC.1